MWTCPKCGRTFKRQNQGHFCGEEPKTIDEYISAQPEMAQTYLKDMRNTLRAALPETEEKISWGAPAFWKNENVVIQFASFKKHIGLYPDPEAVNEFREQLRDYKTGKGTIQFPYDRPLPLDLISEIAKWCDSGPLKR